jgi:hypothetical protein
MQVVLKSITHLLLNASLDSFIVQVHGVALATLMLMLRKIKLKCLSSNTPLHLSIVFASMAVSECCSTQVVCAYSASQTLDYALKIVRAQTLQHACFESQ